MPKQDVLNVLPPFLFALLVFNQVISYSGQLAAQLPQLRRLVLVQQMDAQCVLMQTNVPNVKQISHYSMVNAFQVLAQLILINAKHAELDKNVSNVPNLI